MEKMPDDFYTSAYAQKVVEQSPPLPALPVGYQYVPLSIKRDLGGQIIYGYDSLCYIVTTAGYVCLTSHLELQAYIRAHYAELKESGFSSLSSSAPALRVGDWRRFVSAPLDGSRPHLASHEVRVIFTPDEAVLALSAY